MQIAICDDAPQSADVLLPGVEMGAMNGVTLAKTIRRTNQAMQGFPPALWKPSVSHLQFIPL